MNEEMRHTQPGSSTYAALAASLLLMAGPVTAQTLTYTYTYDEAGNITQVAQDNGGFLAVSLDKNGNVTRTTIHTGSGGSEGAREGLGEGDGEGAGTYPEDLARNAQTLLAAFDGADTDNSGSLTLAEVQTVLPGLTQEEFDSLNIVGAQQGGALSEAELIALSASSVHTADQNGNLDIDLSELLRVIQFFNLDGYFCAGETPSEDGYIAGLGANQDCLRHSSDYNAFDFQIGLSELLRSIQFFNLGGYQFTPLALTEDGYTAGPSA